MSFRIAPAVAEATVFGVEHPDWGEQITAAVVLKKRETAIKEDFRQYCHHYLSGFQMPEVVQLVDKLPAAETLSKISRMELRRIFGKVGS